MKTYRQGIMELPEPHRSRALKYEQKGFEYTGISWDSEMEKGDSPLNFKWADTQEDYTYWFCVNKGDFLKAIELCPITPEEQHLIEPKKLKDIASKKVSGFEATARYQIANRVELEREFDNKLNQLFVNRAIDWLYLQYEIYGYLTPQMVEKAKEMK